MANIGVHKSGLGFINPSIIQDITDISNQVYDNFINISSNDVDINDLSNNINNLNIGNIGTSVIGASLYSNLTGTGYNNNQTDFGGGISLGWDAGHQEFGHGCVAIGYKAGVINMGNTKFQDFNVAIGAYAANINQKYRSIAIGAYSGKENQGTASIAIGWNAGYNTQQSTCIAVGKEAGYNNQAGYSIAIGREAGYNNQGFYSICFGDKAGRTATKIDAIAIGRSSGEVAIGQNCIAIGQQANFNSDFSNCIVLNAQTNTALNPAGSSRFYVKPIRNSTTNNILYYDPFSGEITYNDKIIIDLNDLSQNFVDLSNVVSQLNQLQEYSDASFNHVDISGDLIIQGNLTVNGTTTTINSTVLDISDTRILLASSAPNTIATYGAGIEISGNKTITYESGDKFVSNVNFEAPNIIDLSNTVSSLNIGTSISGTGLKSNLSNNNVGVNSISLGVSAGQTTQSNNCISIGTFAGNDIQKAQSIAIGFRSGTTNQSSLFDGVSASAIAIGPFSGNLNQQSQAISIGNYAGSLNQGGRAISIGNESGKNNQGQYAISLGSYAGLNDQSSNTIIINATGATLNGNTTAGLYVKPVANSSSSQILYYNTTDGAITYDDKIITDLNDLSAIVNNPVLSVIPNITAIGTTLISNSSNTKISVNTNYGIDLSGLISVGEYVIISNVNNSVGFIVPEHINGLRIITELIPSGDEIYAFSFNASDNAFFSQTVNETFNIEFLNGKLITAGAINPYIIDLSTNYYTYKTNNDISVNNVNTILLDLSAVVANITDDADIVDLSTNFWDLSGYVNTLENSWVGNATTGLDMSGYDISNVGDIFASRGYNTYQTLGTEKIVNPPSNTLTLGGVNIGALNKRTRTSYASAEECVSTWTTRTTPVNTWNSVCWSPELSLFCAVASSGSNRVITSPDGITWTTRTTNNNEWQSICWSPELSLFCAVSTTGTNNFVMTSPNGITWTTRTTDSLSRSSVCWSPELSLFCAVPFGGNNVLTSQDGITWTTQSISVSNEWRSVCWSPELSLFCAVSSNGSSNRVITSPDGINWTTRTTNNNFWRSVCWSPELSLFCAVSSLGSNNLVMTSPDGINWTTRTTNNYYWISVCWSQELSLFCAVSDTGSLDRVMTSPDGINWTTRTTNNNEWTSVCWSPELSIFCAISRTGTIDGVMTSNIGMPNSKSVLKVNPSHMTITPTGYLGLNKTSPTEVLDVSGNITCNNILQRSDVVKIGSNTGAAAGIGTVAIGDLTGVSGESLYSVLIGKEAGKNNCESYNVAIGFLAGEIDMSNSSVAIGFWAGETNMGNSAVAIGREAGQLNQSPFGVGVGREAAQNNQKNNAIAIGRSAGRFNQNINSISIGYLAGETDQSFSSVAIGVGSGRTTQGRYCVAIGENAGNLNQGENAIAIGRGTATNNQASHAIAVGIGAGNITQGVKGVSIGFSAGSLRQGAASIAIGSNAGHTDQSANSIILNATDTVLNSVSGTNTFYVKPIRNSTSANYLYYDTTSGEITYSATTSDDRLKHNEKDLSNCLSIINLLKPKIYDKTEIILDASYNGDLSGIEHYKEVGFIAQEVLNDIPDISFVVGETQHYNYVEDPSNIEQNIQVEGDKTYFLNYNHIFVYGIKAIQELSAELKATKLELANLKQLLDDMDVI